MLEIDGKKYRLKEAYVLDESDVEHHYGWDEEYDYVDVARREVRVERAFVLVEVEG